MLSRSKVGAGCEVKRFYFYFQRFKSFYSFVADMNQSCAAPFMGRLNNNLFHYSYFLTYFIFKCCKHFIFYSFKMRTFKLFIFFLAL